MEPPFPAATPTWHNNTYEAISPSRPELSVRSKTVIITGAGSGIGRETASAFISAGAERVFLLGRNEANLRETKQQLPKSNAECSIHVVDILDKTKLASVAVEVGRWDILILNAGFLTSPAPIAETTVDDWWQSFETNTKGTMMTAKAFLPTANPSHASILGVTTGASALPPAMLPGISAYIGSKMAQIKFLEFLASENPEIFVASVHPGMVETAMFLKSGSKAEAMPMDNVQLPAHFIVWLASAEASFLRGRTVWANWDVDELKSQAKDIESGQQMTIGTVGWPYPYMNGT